MVRSLLNEKVGHWVIVCLHVYVGQATGMCVGYLVCLYNIRLRTKSIRQMA